jgi:predicted ribosome quality control (RQC) complex YloA/Tae2 family protein
MLSKDQTQIIKDAIENIEGMKDKIHDFSQDIMSDLEKEAENLDNIREELEEEFEDLSEKDQEGEKGTKIQELVGELEGASESITTLKDAIGNLEEFDSLKDEIKGLLDK